MFWDAFTVSLARDVRFLLVWVLVALVLLVAAFFVTRFLVKINYYCDTKWFFFWLCIFWLVADVGFVAWHSAESQKMVSLNAEFKTNPEQRERAKELCQHDFDEAMKAAKTEQAKKTIIQRLDDNGIKVKDLNGRKVLDFARDAKITRRQADWVQLREKLENKLGRRINAKWEKKKDSKKLSLNERMNLAALKWVDRISTLRVWDWGIICGFICLLVLICGFVVGTKGTPAKVEDELLGN